MNAISMNVRAVDGARQSAIAKALSTLDEIDFEDVNNFLHEKEGHSRETVDRMLEEYKRYIAIRAAYPEATIAISEQVDPYWHANILFTRSYKAMCEKVAGHFIHHNPPSSEDIPALKLSYLDNTLRFYEECFGEPDANWWPKSADAAVCTDEFSWSPALV